jgi:hypothetical protein
MPKSNADAPIVGLLVTPWRRQQHDSDSSRYYVLPVVISKVDGKPRNISRSSSYDHPEVGMLEDLEFGVRVTWYKDANGVPAWKAHLPGSVEYRGHMVLDAHDIASMSKGMARVNRAVAKFPVAPASFGQFCVMLAQALGIRHALYETSGHSAYSYTQCEYLTRDIRAAEHWINEEIEKIRLKVIPATSDAGCAHAA